MRIVGFHLGGGDAHVDVVAIVVASGIVAIVADVSSCYIWLALILFNDATVDALASIH